MVDYNKWKREFRKECIYEIAIKETRSFLMCICEYKDKRDFCTNALQRIECKRNLEKVAFENQPVDFKIDEISFRRRDGEKV